MQVPVQAQAQIQQFQLDVPVQAQPRVLDVPPVQFSNVRALDQPLIIDVPSGDKWDDGLAKENFIKQIALEL